MGLSIIAAICLLGIYSTMFAYHPPTDSITITESMKVEVCDEMGEWDYANFNFITCQEDEKPYRLFGIPVEHLDWKLSPSDNCDENNGHWTGLSFTEIDDIRPRCTRSHYEIQIPSEVG